MGKISKSHVVEIQKVETKTDKNGAITAKVVLGFNVRVGSKHEEEDWNFLNLLQRLQQFNAVVEFKPVVLQDRLPFKGGEDALHRS